MTRSTAIATRGLTKTYKDVRALDNINLDLEPDRIYGLLGRNGAGKTTLMSILTGQNYPDHGSALIFGHEPFEHDPTLSRICFIRESQKYPEDFKVHQAFTAAAMFFENWDEQLAQNLVQDFGSADQAPDQETLAGPAFRSGRHHRHGLTRRNHLFRRTIPRLGCCGSAGFLRPLG